MAEDLRCGSNTEIERRNYLGFGLWTLDFGLWTLGFGLWALDFGLGLGLGLRS
jgi:hypothetical protein